MTTANETIIEWQRATGCENPEAAAAEIARLKDRLIEALEEVCRLREKMTDHIGSLMRAALQEGGAK